MKELKIERKLAAGKLIICVYDVDKSIALPILEESYLYALKLQKIFNLFDEESELSKLNKKRELSVSQHLINVISRAVKYSEITSGEYDISIGKQILQRKSAQNIIPLTCSYKDIKINGNNIELLHKDVIIDLGSIAKGYIIDKIVEFLIENGIESGYVDSRGDLRFFGEKKETLEIQHPRIKEKTLFPFKIKNMAVATSGDYNQFFKTFDNSHILNQKDIISATVVAESATEADAFSTMLFVSNKKTRDKIMKNNPQIKALLIDKKLNQKDYNDFSSLLIDREVSP